METMTIKNEKVWNVWSLLKDTYGLIPLIAGLDKFTNLLTRWEDYLNPAVLQIVTFDAQTFMYFVGIVEIIAGLIVFLNPRIGGYIVMTWLIGISINLISTGNYFDIAVRDIAMAIGAFGLAKLTEAMSINTPLQGKKEKTKTSQSSERLQPTETIRMRTGFLFLFNKTKKHALY